MIREVSVIIPMFNAGSTIEAALDSLDMQGRTDWEAIVVDDGSIDDGLRRVKARAQDRPRIRIISQPNAGLAAARNAGIHAAMGEFLHFLDADDFLLPHALEHLVTAARANPTGAAYGGSLWHDANHNSLGYSFAPSCPSVGLVELQECGRFQPACQLISRKALAGERFHATYPGAEDHDLWLRLAERGVRWTSCDRVVCAYSLRPAGMSRDFETMGASLVQATINSFTRCREKREEFVWADLSRRREASVIDRIAIDHATAGAMRDDKESREAAVKLLQRLGQSIEITPAHAAQAALWMTPYADCQPPSIWRSMRADSTLIAYLASLQRWWSALADAGYGERNLAVTAIDALADLLPDESEVAERIAEHFTSSDTVVIYGLGRAARALAPILHARGVTLIGLDDAILTSVDPLTIGGVTMPVTTHDDLTAETGACVTTTEHDEHMLARLPDNMRAFRWCTQRRALAHEHRARLQKLASQPASHATTIGEAA